MHFAICDDNYNEIKLIERYLLAEGYDVAVYESGEALLADYRDKGLRYDVLFIDLEMQGMGGFETIQAIYAIDDTALVIFVSSHHEYMPHCFACDPVWFIDKPVKQEMLEQALAHAKLRLERRAYVYTFSDSDQKLRLYAKEILYFEGQKHQIIIHLADGTTRTMRKTMKALEQELRKDFCRIHDSYIVNLQHLTFFGSETITEDTPTGPKKRKTGRTIVTLVGCADTLPVGRTYKQKVNEAFLRLQQEKYAR